MRGPRRFTVTLPSGTSAVLEDPGDVSMGTFLADAPEHVRDAWALHCDRRGLQPPERTIELGEAVLDYFAERVCVDPDPGTLSDDDRRSGIPRAFAFVARRADPEIRRLQLAGDKPLATVTRLADRRR